MQQNNNSDEAIIRHILEGNTEGFALLVERHANSLQHFVSRIIAVPEESEEVVMDAFLAAYQHLEDYDAERAPFVVWLRRIAFNTATHHLRVRQPQFVPIADNWAEGSHASDADLDCLLSNGSTDMVGLLDDALERLSPEERTLIHLFYTDERPLREISFILDCSVTALTSRLHRIRKKLYVLIKRLSNENQ